MGNLREAGKTQLYRHFDSRGRLLYVGISLSAVSRLAAHRTASSWAHRIAKVTVETFDTRRAALYAEAKAIADEKPRFNRHKPDPGDFIAYPACTSCGDRAHICVSVAPRRCEWSHRADPTKIADGFEAFGGWLKQELADEWARSLPSGVGGRR